MYKKIILIITLFLMSSFAVADESKETNNTKTTVKKRLNSKFGGLNYYFFLSLTK